MADFTQLKDGIRSKIKSNGKQEITGAILQEQLVTIVSDIEREYNQEVSELKSNDVVIDKSLGKTSTQTDLSGSIINGRWETESFTVGSYVTPTKVWDGSWRSIEYHVKAGDVFRITGTGGQKGRLYLLIDTNGIIQEIAGSEVSATNYELSVKKDGILYCSFLAAKTYSIYEVKTSYAALENMNQEIEEIRVETTANVGEISARTKAVEDFLGYRTSEENLASSMLNGYWKMTSYAVGTQASPTKVWDGSWRSLEYHVKAGEVYVITGKGGLNGRLYCLLDSAGIVQKVAAESVTQTNFELAVTKDGTLYCSFIAETSYSVIKKSTAFNEIDPQTWKRGSYEFGKTCDCDYTAPEIDVWHYPDSGKRVVAINAYYDELVSQHPKYVSMVDCDSLLAAAGISKPDSIKDCPLRMYRFLPPRTPNASGSSVTTSRIKRIKALVLTGTHPEYMSIWDMINTMRLVCRSWQGDKNLEELRWNVDLYIVPCLNLYGVNVGSRLNENGVDINRNAPTADWTYQGVGGNTFGGDAPASEYSTKAYMYLLDMIKPEVVIDHHATNVGSGDDEGDGKNMIYVHSTDELAIDVGGVVISQMTRKWKERYSDTFPTNEEDPTTIYGFSRQDDLPGSLSKYASEQGSFGSTYESNYGILYKNKQYGTAYRQNNTVLVATCATEGFINYLVRLLKSYSEIVGVKE